MPQKNKLVDLSIIVPVYNEINYLDEFTRRLLDSFEDQDAEYIFINDGSTDGTSKILKRYKEYER